MQLFRLAIILICSTSVISHAKNSKEPVVPLEQQFINCRAGFIGISSINSTSPDMSGEGTDWRTEIKTQSPPFKKIVDGQWLTFVRTKENKYLNFFASASQLKIHGNKFINFSASIRDAATDEVLATVSDLTIAKDSSITLTAKLPPATIALLDEDYKHFESIASGFHFKWVKMYCNLEKIE